MAVATVLIIANANQVISEIQVALVSTVYSIHIARDANSAESFLTASKPEIILVQMDIKRSDAEPFYTKIHAYSPSSEIILLCNVEDVKCASELVRQKAAYDYFIINPLYDSYRLLIMIEKALERQGLMTTSGPLATASGDLKENSDPPLDAASGRSVKNSFAQEEKVEDSMLDPTAMAAMGLELIDPVSEQSTTPPPPAIGTKDSKRVLVIEDEGVTMTFIEYALTSMGCSVLKADTAIKGLELARQKRPDLILLDVILPGMNGVEALQKLKRNLLTKKIRVIMMTSLSDKAMVSQCIEAQCDDYIVKPFTEKVLKEKVHKQIVRDRVA